MKTELIFKTQQGQELILETYEKFLSLLPYIYEQIMIPTRYGQTFCIACGDLASPPLILIHGSGSNTSAWIGEINEYSRNFRVYAIDIIGEPGKSEPNRPSMDGSTYADWILDILNYLNIKKGSVNIAGMSLGGWMALKFATSYPEYVNRLVLLCPGGITNLRLLFALKSIYYSFYGDDGIKRISNLLFYPETIYPEVEQVMMLVSKNFNYRRYVPLFSDEEFKKLNMPVLLIAGAHDVMFNTKKSEQRFKRLLPHGKVRIIPNASHVLLRTSHDVISFFNET